MEKNEIYIGLEPARFVEKLDYEIRILTNITSFLINRGYDTNSEIFQYYYRTLEARRIQWDEARRILGEEVPVEGRNQEWWLDYQTGILHYDTPEAHSVLDIKETKSNSQTRKLRYGRPEQFTDQMARIYNNAGKSVRSISFQLTDDCTLNCFAAGTKILMSDYSYKNIEDIKVGDMVLGVSEQRDKFKFMRFQPTRVTHVFNRHDMAVKVTDVNDKSVITTKEHPFLNDRKVWTRVENLDQKSKVIKFLGYDTDVKIPDINNNDYILGYIVGIWLGDGHIAKFKNGEYDDSLNATQSRLALKDIEVIDRIRAYFDILGIEYHIGKYKISEKENLYTDAIYLNAASSEKLRDIIFKNFKKNQAYEYMCGFLAGIYDAEGYIGKSGYIRIYNTNKNIINECEKALLTLKKSYVFDVDKMGKNYTIKTIRILNPHGTNIVLSLLKIIQPAITRKGVKNFYDRSLYRRIGIKSVEYLNEYIPVYNFETETHNYVANDYIVHNCTYCYQINKGHHRMPFDVAKRFIDILLANKNPYINLDNTAGVIMDFIGGEPLMEPELIDQIATYFFERMITEKHPWLFQTRMSMSSNGTLYFKEEVNKVLQKWQGWLSFNVSIDGNKELHDACRVFPDGSGSYDIAMAAVKDWISKGYYMGSKMTLAPANIKYTFDAVKGLIKSGYDEINLNCVFEKGWTDEDATTLYYQLKKLADYLIDNDLYKDHFLSIFSESIGNPLSPEENGNWCWAKGTPILTVDGYKPIEEIKIGDLVYTEKGNVRAVTNTMHHKAENCVEIKPNGFPVMVCTSDHKLFARHVHGEDYGKIDIASIYNQGLEIATNLTNETDGSRIFVRLDSYKKVSPREVYNITVAEEHSYIAGNLMSANCGGTGSMIAVDYKGDIYPCIRYMESSLGDKVKPLIIGNVYDGIMSKQCEKDCVKCLEAITRRSQSTDECFYCPIAQGCAWCSGYNYQEFGTANKRATYICEMHKARVLANVYYWNKVYRLQNNSERYKNNVPNEWALKIISQDEIDMLNNLAKN